MYNACKSGNLDLVKYIVSMSKSEFDNDDMVLIVSFYEYYIDNTCLSGNIELVKYLMSLNEFDINLCKLDSACKSGNINLVKYLLELGIEPAASKIFIFLQFTKFLNYVYLF